MTRTSRTVAPKTPLWARTGLVFALVFLLAVVVLGVVLAVAEPFSPLQPLEVAAQSEPQSVPAAEQAQSEEVLAEPEEEVIPDPQQFIISAAGDVLIHEVVAYSAWNGERYQFSSQFADIEPYLAASDVSICNMEIPVKAPGEGPTGFPVFGAPYELVEELSLSGFTGCTTASNHAMDQGFSGLARTLDAFDEAGMGHQGTARTAEESQQAQFYTVEKGDVTLTIANIAATYGTNGIPLADDAPWSVSFIESEELIQKAREARAAGADIVVASLHCCGVEYITYPDEGQLDTTQALAASGEVDIVISHHAHVPKPMQLLEGGPNGNGMWVAYGLGNMISNQGARWGQMEETESGLLAFFFVDFDGVNPPVVTEASWATVTVDYANGYRLIVANEEGVEVAAQGDRPAISSDAIWYRREVISRVMEQGDGVEQTGVPENEPGVTTVVSR